MFHNCFIKFKRSEIQIQYQDIYCYCAGKGKVPYPQEEHYSDYSALLHMTLSGVLVFLMCRLERLICGGLLGLFVGSTPYRRCTRDLVLRASVVLVFGTCSCSRVDGGMVGTELTVTGLDGGVSVFGVFIFIFIAGGYKSTRGE